jgi:hypothetical protein
MSRRPEVPTPGTNVKRVVYRAIDHGTGQLTYTHVATRSCLNFMAFLTVLSLVHAAKKIQQVCDDGWFKIALAVQAWLTANREKEGLYWLAPYCPGLSRSERPWSHMKRTVPANVRFKTRDDLVTAFPDSVSQISGRKDATGFISNHESLRPPKWKADRVRRHPYLAMLAHRRYFPAFVVTNRGGQKWRTDQRARHDCAQRLDATLLMARDLQSSLGGEIDCEVKDYFTLKTTHDRAGHSTLPLAWRGSAPQEKNHAVDVWRPESPQDGSGHSILSGLKKLRKVPCFYHKTEILVVRITFPSPMQLWLASTHSLW